jgi:hypothetical protein
MAGYKFCYEVRVPHNFAFFSDNGKLTREQVIKQIEALIKSGEHKLLPCDWDEAEVSKGKEDY